MEARGATKRAAFALDCAHNSGLDAASWAASAARLTTALNSRHSEAAGVKIEGASRRSANRAARTLQHVRGPQVGLEEVNCFSNAGVPRRFLCRYKVAVLPRGLWRRWRRRRTVQAPEQHPTSISPR